MKSFQKFAVILDDLHRDFFKRDICDFACQPRFQKSWIWCKNIECDKMPLWNRDKFFSFWREWPSQKWQVLQLLSCTPLSVCSSSSKRKKRFSLFKEFFRLLSCLPWSLNMSFAVLLISMKLIHYMKSIACIRGNTSDNHSTVAQWLEHRSAESEGMRFDTSWGLRIFLCPTLGTRRKQQLFLLWSFSFLFKSFWYFVYVPILLED